MSNVWETGRPTRIGPAGRSALRYIETALFSTYDPRAANRPPLTKRTAKGQCGIRHWLYSLTFRSKIACAMTFDL